MGICDSGRRRGLTIAVSVVLLGVRVTLAGDEKGNVEFLQRQVKYLSEALAAAKAEVDDLRARLERRAYEDAGGAGKSLRAGAAVEKKEYRILDVNKELGMVILDGGRRDGIQPGLQFAVIEEGRAMATVRVVDARAAVAGAVIQKTGWALPRVQDRAVVVTGSAN